MKASPSSSEIVTFAQVLSFEPPFDQAPFGEVLETSDDGKVLYCDFARARLLSFEAADLAVA